VTSAEASRRRTSQSGMRRESLSAGNLGPLDPGRCSHGLFQAVPGAGWDWPSDLRGSEL